MLLQAQAARLNSSLYEEQVPVSSQTPEEQAKAVKTAFQKVLLKIIGSRRILTQAPLNAMLKDASKLVQQFRYDVLEENNSASILWVRFDPKGVQQLLQQYSLPTWGQDRPTLLLWIAVKEDKKRYLLDASTLSPIIQTLKSEAEARGIFIIFPLWDLEDQARLSFSDIWGNFPEPILAASSRYPATVQIAGRILHQKANDWQVRWALYGANKVREWSTRGEFAQALRNGIDEAVDVIRDHVAPITDNSSLISVKISITNVASFTDYARLLTYLNSLSRVKSVRPVQLSRAEAVFKLKLQGDVKSLIDSILFGRVLAQVEEGNIIKTDSASKLNYRLLP